MYSDRFDEYLRIINDSLNSKMPVDGGVVGSAMKYSIENGGKRIRPLFTLEFCRLCSGNVTQALDFACAIEMIHTYSLIHDDLPCMDDDYMRRGKPSCHVKFGEEYALLAGDALLTFAFETVMNCETVSAENKIKAGKVLAEEAGYAGMIGGQMLDLKNEGKKIDTKSLCETDKLKTGALIECAAILGAIAANANEEEMRAAKLFAENIGLAFQIVDDILDVTGNENTLGKPIGSDSENDKNTYVSLLGLEEAQTLADTLTHDAKTALNVFGKEAQQLCELADFLAKRKN